MCMCVCVYNFVTFSGVSGTPCTLFRGSSMAATLMEQYMSMTCTEFVQRSVRNTINKIMECKVDVSIQIIFTLRRYSYYYHIIFHLIEILQFFQEFGNMFSKIFS